MRPISLIPRVLVAAPAEASVLFVAQSARAEFARTTDLSHAQDPWSPCRLGGFFDARTLGLPEKLRTSCKYWPAAPAGPPSNFYHQLATVAHRSGLGLDFHSRKQCLHRWGSYLFCSRRDHGTPGLVVLSCSLGT